MTTLKGIVLAGLMAGAPVLAPAAVVTQDLGTLNFQTSDNINFIGQSFTTPVDFLYGDLSFNFYAGFTGTYPNVTPTTPAATGTAFILTQPYAGTPADLGLTTPGFLAASISSTGGAYTFNPGVILAAGTTYYLYENAIFPTAVGSSSNTYAGGQIYLANMLAGPETDFAPISSTDLDFTLNGTVVGVPTPPVPEPSTLMISFVGAAGGVGLAARRLRLTT